MVAGSSPAGPTIVATQPPIPLPATDKAAVTVHPMITGGVALVLAMLTACATPVILLRNETTGEMARCGGNTIGTMEGRSTEQASDAACVRDYEAKGFRRTSEAEEKLRHLRTAPAVAPPKPIVPVEARWLLAAENLARASGCSTPLVTLAQKGAGQERFAVVCAGGQPFAPIACDFDGCRIVAP